MIIIYAANKMTPQMRAKLKSLGVNAKLIGKGSVDVNIRQKLRVKALTQPRRKDGRFAKPIPKPSAIEKNPMVSFTYASKKTPWQAKDRLVRLISVTDKHITGLEKLPDTGKWQFKKFLKSKAARFNILSFNQPTIV